MKALRHHNHLCIIHHFLLIVESWISESMLIGQSMLSACYDIIARLLAHYGYIHRHCLYLIITILVIVAKYQVVAMYLIVYLFTLLQ